MSELYNTGRVICAMSPGLGTVNQSPTGGRRETGGRQGKRRKLIDIKSLTLSLGLESFKHETENR